MSTVMNDVYLGSRGDGFKNMIISLLKRGKLKPKYIELLTDNKSMESYGQAFTASSADRVNNYERFEQLGDVTANKFIVWYSYKRFPQLDCTDGVKVVARLRINYGAKQFFAQLAEQLGFWEYISAAEDGTAKGMKYRKTKKKDLLEDCIESFVGCTEYLLDNAFRPGVGYGIVYDILSDIFDGIHMSLKYEDLYDPKTRVKETFDAFKKEIGNWHYIDTREAVDGEHTIARSILYQSPIGTPQKPLKQYTGQGNQDFTLSAREGWIMLGQGLASAKADAQQKTSEQGLETLKRMGYYKEPPPEYKFFCS